MSYLPILAFVAAVLIIAVCIAALWRYLASEAEPTLTEAKRKSWKQ